jgi:hypothetical protein
MAFYNKLTNSINIALNGFLDPDNMGLDNTIKYICALHTEVWAKQISLAAILKFKITDVTKSVNNINNTLSGFPVSDNLWFDTKIKGCDGLEPEICKSKMFSGCH